MLGLSLSAFTTLHVVISLVGIASGLIVAWGMLGGSRMPGMTALFLVTTVATSVTGFMFPFGQFLPSHAFGVISLIVLAAALLGLYVYKLSGRWRAVYLVAALVALYLNCFVGVVQAFQKTPLRALAPTQSEPPFAIAQGILLVLFVVIGWLALRRFPR